jgi:hypothetical protein
MRHRNPKVAVLVVLATVAAGASGAAGASPSSTDALAPRALATGTSARAASSSALRDAVALVRSKGYTPDSTRHYKSWARQAPRRAGPDPVSVAATARRSRRAAIRSTRSAGLSR